MIKEDLLKVYAYAGAIWSSFKIPESDLEARLLDEVWFMELKEFDLQTILAAINEYARNNNFCNVVQIGELCRKYKQIQDGTYIDEEKVFQEIVQSVSWDNCRENFNKLSPFAKQIVGGSHMLARWSRDDAFDSVVSSNLRKQIHNALESQRMEKIVQDIKNNKQLTESRSNHCLQ